MMGKCNLLALACILPMLPSDHLTSKYPVGGHTGVSGGKCGIIYPRMLENCSDGETE